MLTIADEGGMSHMLTIADGGGRGVQEPLILADVICEQPLIIFVHIACIVQSIIIDRNIF